jgi:hypothetical protein
MHYMNRQDVDEVVGNLTFGAGLGASDGKIATVWHPHDGHKHLLWPVHGSPSRVTLPEHYVLWADGTHDLNGFHHRLFDVVYWHEKRNRPICCFLASDIDTVPDALLGKEGGTPTMLGFPISVDARFPPGLMTPLNTRDMRVVQFLEEYGPMSRTDARLVAVTLRHGSDLFDWSSLRTSTEDADG